MTSIASQLLEAGRDLREDAGRLRFGPPVTHVYNPLEYAWENYAAYVRRFAGEAASREIVLLGMNPGPWGMAQTGIPFGVVWASRDWMRLAGEIGRPAREHPKRPVRGHECARVEVSGDRLWGWARERFQSPEKFFARFFILNYCPLSFMEDSGRNFVPEKLPRAERERLFAACDRHLERALAALRPRFAVGVGKFAEGRLRAVIEGEGGGAGAQAPPVIGSVPHPSPASPLANAGWDSAMDMALASWE